MGAAKDHFWAILKLTFSTFWWFVTFSPENGQNSIVKEHVIILEKYQDNVVLKTSRVIFHWLGETKYEKNVLLTPQGQGIGHVTFGWAVISFASAITDFFHPSTGIFILCQYNIQALNFFPYFQSLA